MMRNLCIGKKVNVSMSDPWDFVTENGGVRLGVIEDVTEGEETENTGFVITLSLDTTVKAGTFETNKIFAYFRHVGTSSADFCSGQKVYCNFSSSFAPQYAPQAMIAFIGALQIVSAN